MIWMKLMKINLVVDYGLHASSLTLITQKLFLELGKRMNKEPQPWDLVQY